jgi:hypothetical protein
MVPGRGLIGTGKDRVYRRGRLHTGAFATPMCRAKKTPAIPPRAGQCIGASPRVKPRPERYDDLRYAEPLMDEDDVQKGYKKLPAEPLADRDKEDYA